MCDGVMVGVPVVRGDALASVTVLVSGFAWLTTGWLAARLQG